MPNRCRVEDARNDHPTRRRDRDGALGRLSGISRGVSITVALGLVLGACGSEDAPTEAVLPECTAGVVLHVSPGPTPEFSWEPACRASMLRVQLDVPTPSATQWLVSTFFDNELVPPIQYGRAPVGAFVPIVDDSSSFGQPLLAGTRYRVNIFRNRGGANPEDVVVAGATFTP